MSISPRRSMASADLTRTPCRPAVAMADSSGGMVARTTAHGEATIMKVIARSSAPVRSAPRASGTAKTASVAATTPTAYRCSTFSMNSCVGALVREASSTRVTIRAITESAGSRSTRTRRAPVPLRVPAKTSSPGVFRTGSGSPVMVAWSASLVPSRTRPSAPIRSPGRISRMSPTERSEVGTVSSVPPSAVTRVAVAGARSSRPRTESAVRAVARASRAPEVAKMTISRAPSRTCPIAAAPRAATIISRSTSRVFSRSARSPSSAGSQPPATYAIA